MKSGTYKVMEVPELMKFIMEFTLWHRDWNPVRQEPEQARDYIRRGLPLIHLLARNHNIASLRSGQWKKYLTTAENMLISGSVPEKLEYTVTYYTLANWIRYLNMSIGVVILDEAKETNLTIMPPTNSFWRPAAATSGVKATHVRAVQRELLRALVYAGHLHGL